MNYFKERLASFKYAIAGIVDIIKSQANPKIHLIIASLAIVGGIYLNISIVEWCMIILCIVLVLSAETFNSAIEYLADLATPDYHLLAQKTKDAAAGAVLIAAMGAAIVGSIIFLPKIFHLF